MCIVKTTGGNWNAKKQIDHEDISKIGGQRLRRLRWQVHRVVPREPKGKISGENKSGEEKREKVEEMRGKR